MRRTLPPLSLATLAALCCGPALGSELTPEQLLAADAVLVGAVSCELKQSVHLRAVDGRPGHFELTHKQARYTLVPEVTRTGAIRLEDRQAGMVWLQIPAKSMLLNTKMGRREVDGCMHPMQIAQAATPAPSIGIAVPMAMPAAEAFTQPALPTTMPPAIPTAIPTAPPTADRPTF